MDSLCVVRDHIPMEAVERFLQMGNNRSWDYWGLFEVQPCADRGALCKVVFPHNTIPWTRLVEYRRRWECFVEGYLFAKGGDQ